MRNCIGCKKSFIPTHRHKVKQKYCSFSCYMKNSDGKARVKNRDTRGSKNPFWGKIPTEAHRKKISIAKKGFRLSKESIEKIRESLSGIKCYAWTGGKECYWRKIIPKKDGYRCTKCGFSDRRALQVDHIKSKAIYPELKNDPNNMVTLCANCHRIKTVEDVELKNFIRIKRNGK